MSIQVIQNYVYSLVLVGCHHIVHEIQELPTATALVVPHFYQPGSRLQRGKQSGSPMPLVFVVEPGQGLAVGQPEPPLGTLKGLNAGLFIHAQDHGILWRVQIQTDDSRRLWDELRIGTDASTATSRQGNSVLAENPPDVIVRHIAQGSGQ